MAEAVCRLHELVLPIEAHGAVLNLSLGPGEVLLLEGGTGGGKTTLLKLIAGLIRPARGRVELFGRDLTPLSQRKMRGLRERLGVVFERDGLIASWGVRENLLLPLRYRSHDSEAAHEKRILEAVAAIGESPDLLDRQVSQLTGRQRRRLALLRAIVLKPELMLLDELPTYLSADEAETLRIIAVLNRLGCAIIASAPASWTRLFPGRRVEVVELKAC